MEEEVFATVINHLLPLLLPFSHHFCYIGREVRLSEEERLFIDALREMNQVTAKAAAAGHSSESESDDHRDDEHFSDCHNESDGESPCRNSVFKGGKDVPPMHTPPSGLLATEVLVAEADTNSEDVLKGADSNR